MQKYEGQCHCGFIRFSFVAGIDHARVCNCSICAMRGSYNFRISKSALHVQSGWEGISIYRRGSETAADYFCPTCGISPFRRPSNPTEKERAQGVRAFEGWAINLKCVKGVELDGVPIAAINGAAI